MLSAIPDGSRTIGILRTKLICSTANHKHTAGFRSKVYLKFVLTWDFIRKIPRIHVSYTYALFRLGVCHIDLFGTIELSPVSHTAWVGIAFLCRFDSVASCSKVLFRNVCRRRRAAAADRMSASRRRRFRDVFTSCRTPAIGLCWEIYVMPFTIKLEHLQKQKERCGRVLW